MCIYIYTYIYIYKDPGGQGGLPFPPGTSRRPCSSAFPRTRMSSGPVDVIVMLVVIIIIIIITVNILVMITIIIRRRRITVVVIITIITVVVIIIIIVILAIIVIIVISTTNNNDNNNNNVSAHELPRSKRAQRTPSAEVHGATSHMRRVEDARSPRLPFDSPCGVHWTINH